MVDPENPYGSSRKPPDYALRSSSMGVFRIFPENLPENPICSPENRPENLLKTALSAPPA